MTELTKRVLDVQKHGQILRAKRDTCALLRTSTIARVQKSQARVNAAPFVQEVLERVQRKEHERAVGVYEDLLGAFLSDVLPGERHIYMDLYSERGAPALDIYLKKGQNAPLEDAYLGTGGSVTNLLSTGLRLVALLRSGRRRFLVLDESDCWIETALIPKYASIVAEMARTLHVQVLMISHHPESLFKDHIPHRLLMTKTQGLVRVDWSMSSDLPTWEPAQEGMRSLALKHFQSHQHTIIPLGPEVTLLQGANDIGKSAIVNALRAVFDGDSNDTLIQHHKTSAQVTIDFGPDHILSWERFRKGKVKVSYRLKNAAGETLHASDGTKTPDWLLPVVKIGRIDGLDVQIGQQQDPTFLLNQPASQRAKALAIGQESGHVQTMMLLEKQQTQEAKTIIKQGEQDLERLRHEQEALRLVPDERQWIVEQQALASHQTRLEEARRLLDQWARAQDTLQVVDMPVSLPSMPLWQSVIPKNILQAWQQSQARLHALNIQGTTPSMPDQHAQALQGVLQLWQRAHDRLNALHDLPTNDPALPVMPSIGAKVLVENWVKHERKRALLHPTTLLPQLPVLHEVERQLMQQWSVLSLKESQLIATHAQMDDDVAQLKTHLEKAHCPTCGQEWPHTSSHTPDK